VGTVDRCARRRGHHAAVARGTGVGEFENDRRLTAAEKDTIAKWVAGRRA
jgi:hypothetical protein